MMWFGLTQYQDMGDDEKIRDRPDEIENAPSESPLRHQTKSGSYRAVLTSLRVRTSSCVLFLCRARRRISAIRSSGSPPTLPPVVPSLSGSTSSEGHTPPIRYLGEATARISAAYPDR